MTKLTHTLPKNAVIEDSIAKIQQKLKDLGINIVEKSCLRTLANVWSVSICDRDCSILFSKGHGTSKNVALATALGNFVEQLATHHFWADYYLGVEVANNKFVHSASEKWFQTNVNDSWPDGVFNGESGMSLRDFYNPEGELNASCLIDMNTANVERGICCIPYQCVSTDSMINFPVNIINNLYANNGIASGNTVEVARVNALSGIVGHYIQFKIIAEGLSLPDIPDEVLSRYPDVLTSIQEIQNAGYSLLVQDASLGGKYPVIAMTLLDSKDQGVRSSFGAHPKFELALERALTCLLLGRDLEYLDEFAEAGFDMDEIASASNLEAHFISTKGEATNGIVAWQFLNDTSDYEFIDWDKQDTATKAEQEYKQLCDLIHAEGNEIYISNYNEIGLNTCRIIVPGMSEIYPIDDLVFENNNAGIAVRAQILKADKTLVECEQLIQDLEDLNLDDHFLVSTLIGMPSDAVCIFTDLCVAELITLLALKVQDNERIQEGCEWLLHYKRFNPRRLKTYHCINTILQLDNMTNYATALEKLYTRTILNDALALIDGEDVFPLISQWKMHSLLIDAYKKLAQSQLVKV